MHKQFVLPDDGARHQSSRTKPAAWYGLLSRCGAIALAISLVLNPAGAAATDDSPEAITTADFRYLTLEDLSNIEIAPVSKKSELLSDAPAAIYVITQEDIRRSGATSIPENPAPRAEPAGSARGCQPVCDHGARLQQHHYRQTVRYDFRRYV